MDRRIVRALMAAPELDFIGRFAAAEAEEYGLYAYAVGDDEALVVFEIGEDDGSVDGIPPFMDREDLEERLRLNYGGLFTVRDPETGEQDFDAEAFDRMVDAIWKHFD